MFLQVPCRKWTQVRLNDNSSKMTIETAIKIIEEGLIGEESLPVKIRVRKTIDRQLYKEVIDAINFLIEKFKNEDNIPKSLALCFVDVSNHFYIDPDNITEEQATEIEDMGMKISELANQLFS
jgi:antitoxin component of RelBE/YafQ-DinJ toxin-antitoxin module